MKELGVSAGPSDRDVFDETNQLQACQKRGIWTFMEKNLGMKAALLRDFFHNTWCIQFFDSLKEFRNEIKVLALDANLDTGLKDIMKEFLSKHLNMNFNPRQLRQAIEIY